MTDEQLLLEVEDLIRSFPPQSSFIDLENQDVLVWLGRTNAVLTKWDTAHSEITDSNMIKLNGHIQVLEKGPGDPPGLIASTLAPPHYERNLIEIRNAYRGIQTILHKARYELMMKTTGPLSIAISERRPFDYFDQIRKIVTEAQVEVFFVDPYLDADFVSQYLPQIRSEVQVKLLTSEKRSGSLLPAVKNFILQSELQVEVRICASKIHDRYVFVDGKNCYQSGASFKDGARKSPTTLTQITDAFDVVLETYQRMWECAYTLEL